MLNNDIFVILLTCLLQCVDLNEIWPWGSCFWPALCMRTWVCVCMHFKLHSQHERASWPRLFYISISLIYPPALSCRDARWINLWFSLFTSFLSFISWSLILFCQLFHLFNSLSVFLLPFFLSLCSNLTRFLEALGELSCISTHRHAVAQ